MADVPVIPIPTMTYPLSPRQSGFLVPTPGYDNRFGFHYQQGYYWAINPSQDLTVSPSYYSNLGYAAILSIATSSTGDPEANGMSAICSRRRCPMSPV